jgi:hypothetical protein
MIDLDERIEQIVIYPPVSGYEWAYVEEDGQEQKDKIRTLIRDLIAGVTPERFKNGFLSEGGEGYNRAIDEMESNCKKIGL